MALNQSYHLTLQSHPESIRQVDPFLQSIAEVAAATRERYHDVLLAMTEAVNNAILHGNRCAADTTVDVDVQITDGMMVAVITDCGSGFDPATLPDPTDPENLLREGGRGVFLIQHLADSVEFRQTPEGLEVTLKMQL